MIQAFTGTLALFLQQLLNGLALGAVYALVAAGFALFYGSRRVINFAHGGVCMFGALMMASLLTGFFGARLAWEPAVLTVVALCALVGILLERFLFPARCRIGQLGGLAAALAGAIFLQGLAETVWGGELRPFFPSEVASFLSAPLFEFATVVVSRIQFLVLAAAGLLLAGLLLFIRRTRFGRALQAYDQDRTAALLVGIDGERMTVLVFALGSALGGVTGLLAGLYCSAAGLEMGWELGLRGFFAVVLGGLGSLPGALAGGVLLGLAEVFGRGYTSSPYGEGFALAMVILLLWLRPNGLFGGSLRAGHGGS